MTKIEFGNPSAEIVLIQMVGEHEINMLEKEIEEIKKSIDEDFRLIAIKIDDWNAYLSPWEAPAVFGEEKFSGGASTTLETVTELCVEADKIYFIGGYSLAGLFALWSAYQTNVFQGVASASPSIWFPGFVDYMKKYAIKSSKVYLSLGDKEERTRNQVLATVGEKIREAHECLREQDVECVLEWNSGNHFKDTQKRTTRAFSEIIKMYLMEKRNS